MGVRVPSPRQNSSDIPAKVLQNWGSGTVEDGGSTPPHSTRNLAAIGETPDG